MTSAHEVRIVTAEAVITLMLVGEVDLTAVEDIREASREVIEAKPKTLVVDLSESTFLDSAGIGALIGVRNAVVDHKIGLRLVPGPSNVMRVLEIVGLSGAFDFTA